MNILLWYLHVAPQRAITLGNVKLAYWDVKNLRD